MKMLQAIRFAETHIHYIIIYSSHKVTHL